MKRVLKILAAAGLMPMIALPAFAQQGWAFGGVTFLERAGWCTRHSADTMEIHRCDAEVPYVSVSVAAPPPGAGQSYNAATIAAGGAAEMGSSKGPGIFNEVLEPLYGTCTGDDYSVVRNPIPEVAGFTVVATLACAMEGEEPETVDFKNFSGFVTTPAGGLWVVSYDYPHQELTPEDIALVQSIARKIASDAP